MTVKYHENVGHSPAWVMIPEALLELENSGLGAGMPPLGLPVWNDPAMVYYTPDYKAVGFMTYRPDATTASWFILLAWVDPGHRRKGVHTALFAALRERAMVRGDILKIISGTHIDNYVAQDAFERQGRKRISIHYEYKIATEIPGIGITGNIKN